MNTVIECWSRMACTLRVLGRVGATGHHFTVARREQRNGLWVSQYYARMARQERAASTLPLLHVPKFQYPRPFLAQIYAQVHISCVNTARGADATSMHEAHRGANRRVSLYILSWTQTLNTLTMGQARRPACYSRISSVLSLRYCPATQLLFILCGCMQ